MSLVFPGAEPTAKMAPSGVKESLVFQARPSRTWSQVPTRTTLQPTPPSKTSHCPAELNFPELKRPMGNEAAKFCVAVSQILIDSSPSLIPVATYLPSGLVLVCLAPLCGPKNKGLMFGRTSKAPLPMAWAMFSPFLSEERLRKDPARSSLGGPIAHPSSL